MRDVHETQKAVITQTDNWIFDTSILVILVDFGLGFWYEPLTLYKE